MKHSRTRGAVAAGNPDTVAAGVATLEAGGNAFDAMVACALAAMVAEPLLTSFGGGGLATFRTAGARPRVLSFFSRVPGLGRDRLDTDFHRVPIDYGPTQQDFYIGPASAAVPGTAPGLAQLHERYGRIPLSVVAEPAAALARRGWSVTPAASKVSGMLWPIVSHTPPLRYFFGTEAGPHAPGHRLENPDLADVIELFAREGVAPFREGPVAAAMLAQFGGERGNLTARDLREFEPHESDPLAVRYRDCDVFLPPPPAAGGSLIAFGLGLLERAPQPVGEAARLWVMSEVQRLSGLAREKTFFDVKLTEPRFLDFFLAASTLDAWAAHVGPGTGYPPPFPPLPGGTTHISTVDEEGNAVSYTTSIGESCGHVLAGTGILMNNFLGEEDVNPLGPGGQPPGTPLQTMMTPTLLSGPRGLTALGTGGANRIRTAVLQLIHYLVDREMPPDVAVAFPRLHLEGHDAAIEEPGWQTGTLQAFRERLAAHAARYAPFDHHSMFFGGINLAARATDGSFVAVGDDRRSGEGAVVL